MDCQNMTIFLLEILYYSFFLRFARNKNDFIKVFIMYLISNIGLYFIGFESFYAYTLYLVEIVLLARLFKMKLVLYDTLVILVSLMFKLLMEIPFFIILGTKVDLFIWVFIIGIFKNIVVILLRNKLSKLYIKGKKKWDNNNFYIRYAYSIILYSYIIASIVYLISIV